MAIFILILALAVSVALFFMLAIKFGNPKKASTDVLDLNSFPQPTKEKEVLLREDPEDLIV